MLPSGAKLLYGEVTALSNQKGYCYASNSYFSKLYHCTPQAISKWFKQLESRGHVAIEYVGNPGTQERRVSIGVDSTYQSQLRGVSTHVEQNNTSNSIVIDIIVHFNKIASTSYRTAGKKSTELIRARLADGFPPEDLKKVIEYKFRQWTGTEMEKFIRPSTLFAPSHFEEYLQESRRTEESTVNTDAELNTCELSEEMEGRYERYIGRIIDHYPQLFASRCRVLSKAEFSGWIENRIMPGLRNQYTDKEILSRIDAAHSELNTSDRLRGSTATVSEYLFFQFRAKKQNA